MIECRYPHVVEMAVPPEGFSNRLRLAMESFHVARNILRRFGRPTRRDCTEYCRWCFESLADAADFYDQFGGEILSDRVQEFAAR
jgi:hypothetical protein